VRVDYELLQVGQLPIFGRPDKGMLRRWMPGVLQVLPSWERLLLDDEGLATTPAGMGWRRVAPPCRVKRNYVLDMINLNEPLFVPYLERAASTLPSKRGSLVVVLHAGCVIEQRMLDEKGYQPFYYFGLLHDPSPKFDMPPPKTIAAKCPRSIGV